MTDEGGVGEYHRAQHVSVREWKSRNRIITLKRLEDYVKELYDLQQSCFRFSAVPCGTGPQLSAVRITCQDFVLKSTCHRTIPRDSSGCHFRAGVFF